MILPDKKDSLHEAWMYRVLEAVADNSTLAEVLYFKGGTCASILGWLDRFSIDLDFDFVGKQDDIVQIRAGLENIFKGLGLSIKDKSKNGIQYFLKYENKNSTRNTLKIDASFPPFNASKYAPRRLMEIDRILNCQTIETMFAHKLVAVIDRFEKTTHIAGRDIYDIHHFFMAGYEYDAEVIRERRKGIQAKEYLRQLIDFIEKEVTDRVITEDLSPLLRPEKFVIIRKVLKREVLSLLRKEISSLG